MMPEDCPGWEYTNIQKHDSILKERTKKILIDLRQQTLDTLKSAKDTRDIHYYLFEFLTPDEIPYYAGHYRGEDFRCLKYYNVQITSDPRVGFPCDIVLDKMKELSLIIDNCLKSIDAHFKMPESQISLKNKILYLIAIVCHLFEVFLRIHPYANGNGHVARFFLWCILGRYRLWPYFWPIHPRPKNPYINLIKDYRNGNHEPLERFVYSCLLNNRN